MTFSHGLTAHWPRTVVWQKLKNAWIMLPPPTLQSSVKGIAVLWSVTPDLLHLLYAVWKHLCETSGSECYLVQCVAQGAQWYCSLGSFIPDLALCPAQLEQACVHSQTLSVDYHQRSCWLHPTSMCPRSGWVLWKKALGKPKLVVLCVNRCAVGQFLFFLFFLSRLRWNASGSGQIPKTSVFHFIGQFPAKPIV